MTSKSIKRTAKRTHLCTGCGHKFTALGRKRHLRQTTQAKCLAVRDSEQANYSQDNGEDDDDDDAPSSPATLPGPEDPEPPPQPFPGDFYGDYAAEDFDDYMEYRGDDDEDGDGALGSEDVMGHGDGDEDGDEDGGDEEDKDEEDKDEEDGDEEDDEDDDEDADNLEEAQGWEPPPPNPLNVGVDPDPDADPGDDDERPSTSAQRRAHEHLWTRTFVVRFPGPHAGSPTTQQQESTFYEQYDAVNDSDDNDYYPFKSCLDWKIAKWAKMRGPGSTAVSELLDIDGICVLFLLVFSDVY